MHPSDFHHLKNTATPSQLDEDIDANILVSSLLSDYSALTSLIVLPNENAVEVLARPEDLKLDPRVPNLKGCAKGPDVDVSLWLRTL